MTAKYFYFAKTAGNAFVPVIECVADEVPAASQVNMIYSELVRQAALKGAAIGSVPRPTHYGVMEFHEIEQSDETESGSLLVNTNGATVH